MTLTWSVSHQLSIGQGQRTDRSQVPVTSTSPGVPKPTGNAPTVKPFEPSQTRPGSDAIPGARLTLPVPV